MGCYRLILFYFILFKYACELGLKIQNLGKSVGLLYSYGFGGAGMVFSMSAMNPSR
jgi:hypothetical protein